MDLIVYLIKEVCIAMDEQQDLSAIMFHENGCILFNYSERM